MTLSKFVYDKLRHSPRVLLIALACAFAMSYFAFPGQPKAATFATITVTSLADDATNNGNCTLREAIQAANTNTAVDACTAGAKGLDMIVFNVGSGVPSIAPTSPLPLITEPVTINGNTGGATRIELNGANAGAVISGLTITGGGSTLQGLVINRFTQNGITIQNNGGNTIKNCVIGLNPAATVDLGNGGQGISVNNSPNNTIGVGNPSNQNIISGNALSGVEIVGSGSTDNKLFNNVIGTNAQNASGLGNSGFGVLINSAPNTVIGDGNAFEEGNVISGNGSDGIIIQFTNGAIIRNNFIGCDDLAAVAIPNGGAGIRLRAASGTQIGGGNAATDPNWISGNTGPGIELHEGVSGSAIHGNWIGTQFGGTSPLGNGSHGISFPADGFKGLPSSSNTIGGSGSLANTVAFNNGAGISALTDGVGNHFTQNSIFSNTKLGIDLGTAGISPNDNLDLDFGPNRLQNFPVITSVTVTNITATLNSQPSTDYRVEFYANTSCDPTGSGEGEVFLGADNQSTDASGNATFTLSYNPVAGKPVITALAINPAARDTSEFSMCFIPGCAAISAIPVSGSLPNATSGSAYSQTLMATGGTQSYTFALTGGSLPSGLTLSQAGVLGGTPTQSGQFSFTVSITDSASCIGQANYTLTVACPPFPIAVTAPQFALPGQNFSYDVTISNPCSNLSLNSTLTINTPANTTFQVLKAPGDWSCATPAVNGTGTISCNNKSFAAGAPNQNAPKATATFTVTLKVNPGTPINTNISHVATVVGNTTGFPPNTATANGITTVASALAADLSVTNASTPPAIAGSNTTFNILATNNTAATNATGVVLTTSVPANTTFQSFTSPAGWTCVLPSVGGTGAITCTVATMATGSANFALTVRVNPNVACDTSISNTVTIQTAGDPVPANNSATAVALSKTQSDVAVNVAAPASTIPDVSAIYTVTVTNNGPSTSFNTMMSDMLPTAFSTEAINASVGSCTGIGGNTVNCNLGALAVGATATITIQVHVPETCQPTNPTNTATVTTGNCLADPVAANNTRTNATIVQIGNLGPGACIPSSQPINAQKPGSVLFGGVFASGATGGAGGDPGNNTGVSLTNAHPRLGVVVHLFFVDGATCSVADSFVCLTANQTIRFLMSDLDPGVVGYMMAMAVDGPPGTAGGNNTGCPISFNYLIGSARIKMTNSPRREAELASESCASEFGSPLPGCDPNKSYAEIPFDGSPQGFNKLPLVLAASSVPSRADGNDTMLLLARIDGNWGTGLKPLGNIFGILYDDTEHAYSFGFNVGTCLLRTLLTNTFPRTTPRFEQAIPAGRTGWMKLWSADNAAILGAIINRHPNADTLPNAFDGGRNLHILRLNERVVITVPVFPPSC